MYYIDKLIEGEEALKAFMERFRPGQKIEWMETIGRCGNMTVHLFYERSDDDQRADRPFREFYWLYMPCDDRKPNSFWDISQREEDVHKMIREGKFDKR